MMRTMIIWLLLNISVAAASTEVAHVPNNSGLGPFSQGSQVQEKALSPVIMGSGFPGGFQEPFMRHRHAPEPVSVIGIVATVAIFFGFIIVFILVEKRADRGRSKEIAKAAECVRNEHAENKTRSRVDQFFDDQAGGN